ncbi:glycosyltransferase family 4 protein [Mucilaginibacter ximonensis]|uniref:Glycosyltransferase family 4 protein n=1 Tax=Mucilaginibacter ximonensis TaxID=538021 RepID=A0ABW5YES9_9SPHI
MPKPLTIGVDIRDLRVAKTGTRTYLEEISKAFKQLENDNIKFKFLDVSIPVYSGNNRLLKMVEHTRFQLWKQVILPLKAFFNGCDIVFCTDNFVPLIHLGFKTIPVFHDAFFWETPENYGRLWLKLYKKTAVPAAHSSAAVVVPTEYAKKRIHHYTHIAKEKLIVVYEGPKSLPQNAAGGDELLNLFAIANKQYILHAGSMFKRKNIAMLIYAFDKLKKSGDYAHLKLVLSGAVPNKHESDYEEIAKAIEITGTQKDIVMTGYLCDNDLSLLYKNALLYAFPSINEGFGIPILEAFKSNLPVLVANNTCLPEVGDDAVIQFNPFDIDDIYQKIKVVVDDKELREELIRKGNLRLQFFSWQKAALQLIELFKKVA